MRKKQILTACFVMLSFLLLPFLSACGGGRGVVKMRPEASGEGGYYKVGNPYKIKGKWYRPEEDYTYDETGIASWYGGKFHDRLTANGETYNKNELTAAHKTLQMPSLARVTNLENGRSIVVRINDRGPYSEGRIIDLSQRSAQLLGFEQQGVAKVRVQVLADESRAIAQAIQTYGTNSEAPFSPQVEEAVYKPSAVESVPLTMENIKPVPRYVQGPVTGMTKMYVQAGSFANKSNAVRLQAKLASLGNVSVTEAIVRDALFYRVRLGPIKTVAQADELLSNVHNAGVNVARILVDN